MKRMRFGLFLLLVALPAIPAAAQPGGPPPGVERPYAVPSFIDLPPAELGVIASASGKLPPLPRWCDGTCVIDIAFFYAPEAIGQTNGSAFPDIDTGEPDRPFGPQTVGALRDDILESIAAANVVFRRARLDAELRFVGLERDPALTGLQAREALVHLHSERLVHARSRYGADLVYAITGDWTAKPRCTALARTAGMRRETARSQALGALRTGCLLGGYSLVTLVGYNLGLLSEAGYEENQGHAPYVPFGHAYVGKDRFGRRYGTLISSDPYLPYFSTTEVVYGRVLGEADISDSARALRYAIPEAARFSPTVVPEEVEDPHGYGCRPSASRACLNERRFDVSARYSTQTVSRAPAKRLDLYGIGDSGSVFYFFEPDNPEMLLKVVNGCWLNDHWWVFGSAATDLVYEVAIEDFADGGGTVEYRHNGVGVIVGDNGYSTAAGVINDTSAFPCGRSAVQAGKGRPPTGGPAAHVAAGYGQQPVAGIVAGRDAADTRDYGCIGGDCLNNWRFSVGANFVDQEECNGCITGAGEVPTHGLGDSGALIYFFEPDNPEMLLKVVDGCAVNGHWWVFGSAATDLGYTVYVDDYATAKQNARGHIVFDRRNIYDHHGGGWITGSNGYSTRTGVISDTSAFPCNP